MEITLDEVLPAVKSFNMDKSPGCDGLTSKFYQMFFGLIGIEDIINYAFENEKLTLTMRRGIIALIWKGRPNEKEY